MRAIKNKKYRGTSSVEAAIVMTILVFITLAIIGFGWLFLRIQQVTNAARHGARVAVRLNAVDADVEQAVFDCLDPVGLTYEGPIITFESGLDPNIGTAVTVKVTGTGLDILNLGNLTLLGVPVLDNFSAKVTMAQEGPEY